MKKDVKAPEYTSDWDKIKKSNIKKILLRRVKINPATKCWHYIGGEDGKGYGRMRVKFTRYLTHRLSYFLHKGIIPKGMFVCHKCDNPICINPKHLWLGTHKENNLDRELKGRGTKKTINHIPDYNLIYKKTKGKLIRPIKFGDQSSNHKLTEKDVLTIRKMKGTYAEIAKKYNVYPETISCAVRGKTWKHI